MSATWEGTDDQSGPEGMLTAFSGGPSAETCRGHKPAERHRFYKEELEKRDPGCSAQIVKAAFLDWQADPWTRGAYSFPAPGQVTTLGPLLARPHADRLHRAGEHTCYKFVGYMEGALQSAAAVARRRAVPDGRVGG